MADNFDKFTERARTALTLAQEEARRFNHNYIGTEHLLLGLIAEREGVAARVLANLGVRLQAARDAVMFIIGRGEGTVVGEAGLTPRAKKVIELAVDEARRLDHRYVGTEHLLLGLIREGEGIAAGVLESLGVSLETVRTKVMQVVTQRETLTGRPPHEEPELLELLGVVALGQSLATEAGTLTALALERYADGFVVTLILFHATLPVRTLATGRLMGPIEAYDDRGGHYTGWLCGRGDVGHQERLSYAFKPMLDPAARELGLDASLGGHLAAPADRPPLLTLPLPPPEE